MANTNDRPSLQTTLEQRYTDQSVGGAYDAKKAGQSTIPVTPQETLYTETPGFMTKAILGKTDFKDAQGNSSKGLSMYVKGLDTRPYKK